MNRKRKSVVKPGPVAPLDISTEVQDAKIRVGKVLDEFGNILQRKEQGEADRTALQRRKARERELLERASLRVITREDPRLRSWGGRQASNYERIMMSLSQQQHERVGRKTFRSEVPLMFDDPARHHDEPPEEHAAVAVRKPRNHLKMKDSELEREDSKPSVLKSWLNNCEGDQVLTLPLSEAGVSRPGSSASRYSLSGLSRTSQDAERSSRVSSDILAIGRWNERWSRAPPAAGSFLEESIRDLLPQEGTEWSAVPSLGPSASRPITAATEEAAFALTSLPPIQVSGIEQEEEGSTRQGRIEDEGCQPQAASQRSSSAPPPRHPLPIGLTATVGLGRPPSQGSLAPPSMASSPTPSRLSTPTRINSRTASKLSSLGQQSQLGWRPPAIPRGVILRGKVICDTRLPDERGSEDGSEGGSEDELFEETETVDSTSSASVVSEEECSRPKSPNSPKIPESPKSPDAPQSARRSPSSLGSTAREDFEGDELPDEERSCLSSGSLDS